MKVLLCLAVVLLMCRPSAAQTINRGDDPITVRQKLINRVKELEQKKPFWQQDLLGTQTPPEARDNYTLLVQIMRESSITKDEALAALRATEKSPPNWFYPALIGMASIVAICCLVFAVRFSGAPQTVQSLLLACFVFSGLYPPWNGKLFFGQPIGYAPIFFPPEGMAYVDFVRLILEWLILGVVTAVVLKWQAAALPKETESGKLP